jgi:nitroreductase
MRPSMLNDSSSILALLETRRSGKPRELVGPGPSAAEMERILTIAARVPDHGKLTPWRFVLVRDNQREELAQLLSRALSEEDPSATPAHHDAEQEFARYAGQLVVLISAPLENHKIPVWEQQLSCGTVGMSLLTAAHSLGFVAGWVTGWRAYSPTVNAAFCAGGERIAGFVFIGRAGRELEDRPRPALDAVVRTWQPPEH